MKITLVILSVMVLAGAGECRAEEAKFDTLTTRQEIRERVASGEQKIQSSQRFRSKIANKQMKVPQIQTRSQEMKVATDMSVPKFTSRQNEMKITDHGAQQIRVPHFKTAEVTTVSSSVGGRDLSRTGGVDNMQINYMGKIMEGRVDFLVNQGE